MNSFWSNIFGSRSEENSVYHFLAKIPVFSGLKTRELQAVERIVHCRDYKAQEVVFRKDDPGVGMYIIQKGSVRIVLPPNTVKTQKSLEKTSHEGQIILAHLKQGDFFGEASLPDGGARSATAVAVEETSLIGLFRPDLLGLCQRDPNTGLKVLWNVCEVLAIRLRHANFQLTTMSSEHPLELKVGD